MAEAICGWTRPPSPRSVLMTFFLADDLGAVDDAVGHEKGAGFQSHTEVQDLKKNNVAV